MNRRSFLTGLGAAVAATIFIPKALDAYKWKRSAKTGMYVPNPEWVNAPYELSFISEARYGILPLDKRMLTPIIFKRSEGKPDGAMVTHMPLRFNMSDGGQQVVPFQFLPA